MTSLKIVSYFLFNFSVTSFVMKFKFEAYLTGTVFLPLKARTYGSVYIFYHFGLQIDRFSKLVVFFSKQSHCLTENNNWNQINNLLRDIFVFITGRLHVTLFGTSAQYYKTFRRLFRRLTPLSWLG